MANIKIVLDTRRSKSDGTFNIIFRITHFKKIYTLNSGISVKEVHWNTQNLVIEKQHPNSNLLNSKIYKDFYKIQEVLIKLGDEFSIQSVRLLFEGKSLSRDETFKIFADRLINQMMSTNRIGNALVYQTAVKKFINFSGEKIRFEQIDYNLLEQFTQQLTVEGLKQNSISNYFRTIRAIYNKAIKQKNVERSFYPFHDITVKTETTIKRGVSKEDIFKLKTLHVIDNTTAWKSLNYFLLSFYLIGISFTDLAYLKPENIIDGRLVYKRKKTHKNYSVKIHPDASLIFKRMHNENNNYLLPILQNDIPEDSLKSKRIIQQTIKTTNKYLKRLSKEANLNSIVTTYVARHSFATIAKKLGYSNEIIAEALGHQYGNKTTNIYLDNFDREVVDAMHQEVIEL